MRDYDISIDEDSIVFAETRAWSKEAYTEDELEKLNNFMIYDSVVTMCGAIYLVMVEINQGKNPGEELYKIVKITTDEETGKIEVHSVNVTHEQALLFCQSGRWNH